MAEHMKTKIGQYAIIIKDKKLLLLSCIDTPYWLFPGGRMDEHEEITDSLNREVLEETGLTIDSMEPFDVKAWVGTSGHRYAVFFLTQADDKEIKLSHEHDEYKWFTYEDAIKDEKIGEPGKEVIQKLRDKSLL